MMSDIKSLGEKVLTNVQDLVVPFPTKQRVTTTFSNGIFLRLQNIAGELLFRNLKYLALGPSGIVVRIQLHTPRLAPAALSSV